jgi:hypothetical protein
LSLFAGDEQTTAQISRSEDVAVAWVEGARYDG